LWHNIEPYPYGDLILNIVTSIVVSPVQLILSVYFIIEVISQFGYDTDYESSYDSYFMKYNLPCFAALVLYDGQNSLQYYYCLR